MYFNEIYTNVEGFFFVLNSFGWKPKINLLFLFKSQNHDTGFKFHMGNLPEEGLKPIVENYDADIVMHVSEEEKEEMSKELAAMKPKTAVVGFSKTK